MKTCHALFAAALAATLAVPAAALAAQDDRTFVTQALTDNTSEIRQGDIFADASDPLIQTFAQRMVTDHSEANTQLIALAKRMHISTQGQLPNLPYTSGVQHPAWLTPQVKAKAIAGLKPVAFFAQQIRDHKQAIGLYQHEIATSHNQRLVSYARQTLPVLRAHLRLAEQDERQEKAQHHG